MSEYQDTRYSPLKGESKEIYARLQQTDSMDSESKETAYILNSDKVSISSKLADLIYGNVEKNQVLILRCVSHSVL